MKFEVNIACNNAAFDEKNINLEVARILNNLANIIEKGYTSSNLRDANGNTCGFASFQDDDVYNFFMNV